MNPVTIACAAIAGAHWAHQEVLNPPGARQNVAGNGGRKQSG